MKRIHLLRFAGAPAELEPLFAAARDEGLRVGWLELPAATVTPLPARLEAATSGGASRAVAVGAGRSLAVKRREGPAVLRDLLREHFLGCALVIVASSKEASAPGSLPGELAEAPCLELAGSEYRLTPPGEAGRSYAAPALAARLRRPRPWT